MIKNIVKTIIIGIFMMVICLFSFGFGYGFTKAWYEDMNND